MCPALLCDVWICNLWFVQCADISSITSIHLFFFGPCHGGYRLNYQVVWDCTSVSSQVDVPRAHLKEDIQEALFHYSSNSEFWDSEIPELLHLWQRSVQIWSGQSTHSRVLQQSTMGSDLDVLILIPAASYSKARQCTLKVSCQWSQQNCIISRRQICNPEANIKVPES